MLANLRRMPELFTYTPYKSDKPDKRFYIITKTNKRIYFGSAKHENFTIHKDEERKARYIKRHQSRENWNDPNTAGFWSRWLLWNKPTLTESLQDIRTRLKVQALPVSKLL